MINISKVTSIFLGVCFITACSSVDESGIDSKTKMIKPSSPTKSVMGPKINKSAVLSAHNIVRSQHGLAPLKWSEKLVGISQEWANKLGRGNSCQMYHSSGRLPIGENLFVSSPTIWSDGRREIGAVSINEVVSSWASEKKWYNYKQNRCQSGKECGHYTQLVWKKTTEVGCSVKVCKDKSQVWVCNYSPAGNFVGSKPY